MTKKKKYELFNVLNDKHIHCEIWVDGESLIGFYKNGISKKKARQLAIEIIEILNLMQDYK